MRWKLIALFLCVGCYLQGESKVEELSPVKISSGELWCVKKVSLDGREPPLAFTLASPGKMTTRGNHPWFSLGYISPDKTLYSLKVRREGYYHPPKQYEDFKKQMLHLLKGLNVVRDKRITWVHPGIIYRMDLEFSPKHNGKVTLKGSVIATKNAFYILMVNGSLLHAEEFFDRFTPLLVKKKRVANS